MIPPMALRRLARVYERGARKYGDDNWRKGQPLRRYIDSCLRHVAAAAEMEEDEDHVFQAVWNLIAFAYTLDQIRLGRLPSELHDVPYDCVATRAFPGPGQREIGNVDSVDELAEKLKTQMLAARPTSRSSRS